jgi:hypothetical protein
LKLIIPRNEFTMSAVAHVRAADTVYDARLIPLLLHEDFSAYPVGGTRTRWNDRRLARDRPGLHK